MAKYILRKWWLALISNLVLSDPGMPTLWKRYREQDTCCAFPSQNFLVWPHSAAPTLEPWGMSVSFCKTTRSSECI